MDRFKKPKVLSRYLLRIMSHKKFELWASETDIIRTLYVPQRDGSTSS